jgi:hypothetical protein
MARPVDLPPCWSGNGSVPAVPFSLTTRAVRKPRDRRRALPSERRPIQQIRASSCRHEIFPMARGSEHMRQSLRRKARHAEKQDYRHDGVGCDCSGVTSGSVRSGRRMSFLLDLVTLIGDATEQALGYLEHHHWFFGLIVIGYIFRLHDKSLHARFDALDKRLDEIRKRLACDN